MRLIITIIFPFLAIGSSALASSALKYEANQYANHSQQEKIALTYFINEAETALPQKMKELFKQSVTIRFSKLDKNKSLLLPECTDPRQIKEHLKNILKQKLNSPENESASKDEVSQSTTPKTVLGRTSTTPLIGHYFVELNSYLLEEIYKGENQSTKFPCGHKNVYRLALATLIHELSHIYDDANLPATEDPKERYQRELCQHSEYKDIFCQNLENIQTTISERDPYKFLTNWNEGILFTKSKNNLYLRSPDPYEYTSLSENFAVNMEFFLLDSEYACHRPEYQEFFEEHFNFKPQFSSSCKPNYEVKLSNSNISTIIDPSRVYEIHYLLADSGQDMSSKWGHSMFRIILCNPERQKVGPECLQDINYHVVVSFRANISDIHMSYWDGFFGGYPSQMFLFTMPEIINEYTIGESRDIKSVPIKLSQKELKKFIYRTLESYWEYQGSYYFLGNNCATESFDFLRGIGNQALKDEFFFIATPKKLYRMLKSDSLLDESVLTDKQSVGRYIFYSFKSKALKIFESLKKSLKIEDLSYDDYLDLKPQQRIEFYLELKTKLGASYKLASQFYSLEYMIKEHLNQKLQKQVTELIDQTDQQSNSNSNSNSNSEIQPLLNSIVIEKIAFLPWFMTQSSYGIPLAKDLVDPTELQKSGLLITGFRKSLRERLKTLLPEIHQDIEGGTENMKFLNKEIQDIIKNQGNKENRLN